jgi:hypothetical protein
MSDILKAQATPQFYWYTCWTSLGANGMPDKLIETGLKQPDQIKISLEKGSKEHTGHFTPDQVQFGPEYLFAFTLPYFKSKILTRISKAKKKDSPTLFSLMGQCFQDIGLTKWTNFVGKQCPDDMHLPKENVNECIKDYLKAVSGFPVIGYQLICWLCIAKKPAIMPMNEFMRHQVQLFSYLNNGLLCQKMELPMLQKKLERMFLLQPKAHQFKFAETSKTMPTDPLWLMAFFKQCQTANKVSGVLDMLKEKKQPKEKKMAHLSVTCSCGLNHRHHCCKNHDHHWSNQRDCNIYWHNFCCQDNQHNGHPCRKEKDFKKRLTRREMIANAITSKRRRRSCTTTIPPLWAWTLCLEKEVAACQGLLLAHALILTLSQAVAKGAMWIIMSPMMTTSKAVPSSASIYTWSMKTKDQSTVQKKTKASLPPLPLQNGKRKSVVPCREQCQQSNIFVSHFAFLLQIGNLICWLILILNEMNLMILLDTSHHKITFEYDEDTTSLVEDQTLTTAETFLCDNSDFSPGNAANAPKDYCYEVEADEPWFNYHEPTIIILKQELLITICTTDTIGTARSQRLFWELLDSGSTISMIKRSALTRGIVPELLGDTKLVRTLVGYLKTQEVVMMQDLTLPKFDKNRRINWQWVFSFWQQQCQIQHNPGF